MPFDAFDDATVLVLGEAARAERDPIVKFYVTTNDTSFSNDDTGSVVDEEVWADDGTRVNVNACL